MIKKSDDTLFDSALIKELLILTYDYEITGKLLKKNIPSYQTKNKKILTIFDTIYGMHYHYNINNIPSEKYIINKDIHDAYEKKTITNTKKELQLFLKCIFLIFEK